MIPCLVVGAGPAGLMAAEALADAGRKVIVADQKPSVGRKFLMAGKSGLNLTKDEELSQFLKAYGDSGPLLEPMVSRFGPAEVVQWAKDLGQDVFIGSSGRVFPKAMKASPLLRAWLERLAGKGVEFRTRWRFERLLETGVLFDTPDGEVVQDAAVTVLAMGGASWRKLGSDGLWAEHLSTFAKVSPFQPSNMGFSVAWSGFMEKHFGAPIKNLRLNAGSQSVRGEIVVTSKGIEGGGVYLVSAVMREGAPLYLDLLPDLDINQIRERLSSKKQKDSLPNVLRKKLKLDPAKIALLNEFGRPFLPDLAPLLKALPIKHSGPLPMDEAISTAGGISFDTLDQRLMIKDKPGVFAAGEMLDWEAPTGGYLITACLATGAWAGRCAGQWLDQSAAAVNL